MTRKTPALKPNGLDRQLSQDAATGRGKSATAVPTERIADVP